MKPLTPLCRRTPSNFSKRQGMHSRNASSTMKARKEFKPSDIYDLKIKTSKLEQETRILRSQLTRTKDRINQNDKKIGNSVGKGPSTNNKGKCTINNVQKSIETAKNALEVLNEKLWMIEHDDKTSLVNELHEEILIAHAEHERVYDELKEKNSLNKKYERLFAVADTKAAAENINEQELSLSAIQESNSELIEKIKMYQNKLQKMKNEKFICERESEGESAECAIQEINDANERHTSKIEKTNALAKEEDTAYSKAIRDLDSKILYQRKIIAAFLKGEDLPPPGEIPEPEEEEEVAEESGKEVKDGKEDSKEVTEEIKNDEEDSKEVKTDEEEIIDAGSSEEKDNDVESVENIDDIEDVADV